MPWMRALVAAAFAAAAPLPAQAVDVLLGWDARGVWDSNVFRSENDEQDDFSLYTGPNLGLRQNRGDVRFNLEYRPRYEAFLDFTDASDFEHFANAHATWSVSKRTELFVNNRFSRTLSLREFVEEPDTGAGDAEAGETFLDRSPTLRNVASGGMNHWLSPRVQLGVNASQMLNDYDDEDLNDSRSYRISTSLRRLLSRRHTVGLGMAFSQQSFEQRFDVQRPCEPPEPGCSVRETFQDPDRVNSVIESFAIYDFMIDRAWTLSLTGGPAWVFPDDSDEFLVIDDGNLEFTGGDTDANMTFYGIAAIRYARRPYSLDLSYTRRFSASSGQGATTNLDVASLLASWNPDRLWRLSLRASWQRQTSAYDQPEFQGFCLNCVPPFTGLPVYDLVSDAIDTDSYRVAFRVARQLTRRLQIQTLATYWYQESKGGLDRDSGGALVSAPDETRDSLRFEIGFSWNFDPIPL